MSPPAAAFRYSPALKARRSFEGWKSLPARSSVAGIRKGATLKSRMCEQQHPTWPPQRTTMACHRQFVSHVPASANPVLRQDMLPRRTGVGSVNPPGPRPLCDQQASASPTWPPARSSSPNCQRIPASMSATAPEKTKIRRQSFALPLETCKPWRKLPPPLSHVFSLKQGIHMLESDGHMQAPVRP